MLQVTQIDHLREVSAQLHYLELSASKQREQAGKTRCHHTPLASLPGAVSAQKDSAPGSLSTCLAPISFPKLPGTYGLQRGPLYIKPFLYNKQERDYIEKAGMLRKLSGGSPCLPLHLHRVARSSIQGFWLTCKVTAAHSQTHPWSPFGPKQRGQARSTGHYYTHLASAPRELLWLGSPVPSTPPWLLLACQKHPANQAHTAYAEAAST